MQLVNGYDDDDDFVMANMHDNWPYGSKTC